MTTNLTNTSESIMDSDLIAYRVQNAAVAFKEYSEKNAALAQSLIDWLKSRVTPGMVIDLSYESYRAQNVPEFMSSMQVVRGNARKAKKFRIEFVRDVDFKMSHFNLATWTCEATPINEKTGADMSGRVGKSLSYGSDSNKSFVTLRFDLFRDQFGEDLNAGSLKSETITAYEQSAEVAA